MEPRRLVDLTLQVLWATSRRTRNRRVHALNGNGPPEKGGPGRAGARQPKLAARALQDLQLAGALRADGWELPASVKADHAVRVYDTRLDGMWLQTLVRDIRAAGDPDNVVLVGGDFVTSPAIEDSVALHPDRLRRWGPRGPCHIVIPPRPHVQRWVDRLLLQVDVEDDHAVFTLLYVADRDRCPAVIDKDVALRMLPQAKAILEDALLEIRVVAVGERAPVVRVPADVRRLPPPTWEPGLLPRNRVLVALTFRKVGVPVPMKGAWIRGSLPGPEPSGVELLRLEYQLAPAVKERGARQEAMRALRKAAGAMGIALTGAHRLEQVQAAHGGIFALLAVPRSEAKRWLHASGCGGLFLRPFWTKDTSPELDRNRFNLVWPRGHRQSGFGMPSKTWTASLGCWGTAGMWPSASAEL